MILVSSALADRSDTKKLAGLLAPYFTVVNYGRRGRGPGGNNAGYTVRHEIDDIAALIEHAGGAASVFGSSAGAVLALRAAAAGLNIQRLALYEPPFAVAPGDFGPPQDFARHIDALIAEDRRGEAVKAFMTKAQGMPSFMVGSMRLMPGVRSNLKAMAHTLPYDIAVMGDTQQGSPLAAEMWAPATAPTPVMTGSKSPDSFRRAARAVTEVLPDADHHALQSLNHGAVVTAPKKLAPKLIEFFQG